MNNCTCKTQRQIAEELIEMYLSISKFEDQLTSIGVSINRFEFVKLLNLAFDTIGFPLCSNDWFEISQKNKIKYIEDTFNREWLLNSTLIDEVDSTNRHSTVKEYVDFLYQELDALKKESPELFLSE